MLTLPSQNNVLGPISNHMVETHEYMCARTSPLRDSLRPSRRGFAPEPPPRPGEATGRGNQVPPLFDPSLVRLGTRHPSRTSLLCIMHSRRPRLPDPRVGGDWSETPFACHAPPRHPQPPASTRLLAVAW